MAFWPALQHSENHVYVLGILLVLRENEYYTYPNLMVCGKDEGAGEIALIQLSQLLLNVAYPNNDNNWDLLSSAHIFQAHLYEELI
jgi:hypothetical protein